MTNSGQAGCTRLYCTIPYCAAPQELAWPDTLVFTVPQLYFGTSQLRTVLHRTALYCIALYCTVPQELEKHTAAFVEQSRVLATWDSAVLSNRHAMLDLETELRGVTAGQQALDKQLGMIETHQKVRQGAVVAVGGELTSNKGVACLAPVCYMVDCADHSPRVSC